MRMLFFILSAMLVVSFGFWAYRVNYDSQAALKRVARLQNEIARERETMTMLRAEWAWLNRPARIRALVEDNNAALGLGPLQPGHFGEVALVSYPPAPLVELEEGWDGITAEDITVIEVMAGDTVPRPEHRPAEIITAEVRQ